MNSFLQHLKLNDSLHGTTFGLMFERIHKRPDQKDTLKVRSQVVLKVDCGRAFGKHNSRDSSSLLLKFLFSLEVTKTTWASQPLINSIHIKASKSHNLRTTSSNSSLVLICPRVARLLPSTPPVVRSWHVSSRQQPPCALFAGEII